ncbi:putative tyrosinase-like protein tyr-3, partial [Exaiptasia diaphana]|uniref:ShKT domain-containing protein n=1 Tax=Exaiptasia diaphana TaxID=2652724 RepID=A0A913YGG4_EXADI
MYKNCKKTCGRCHDGNPYATDVDVGPLSRRVIRTKPCTNALKGCNYWARIGYCSMRPDLMLRKCKLACRACHPEKKCENIVDDHNCNHWAKLGKCSSRMNFMIEKCPKSCNACPSRSVKTKPEKPVGILCPTACKNWLEKGFCFKLKSRCRRTCLARGCDTAPVRLD